MKVLDTWLTFYRWAGHRRLKCVTFNQIDSVFLFCHVILSILSVFYFMFILCSLSRRMDQLCSVSTWCSTTSKHMEQKFSPRACRFMSISSVQFSSVQFIYIAHLQTAHTHKHTQKMLFITNSSAYFYFKLLSTNPQKSLKPIMCYSLYLTSYL